MQVESNDYAIWFIAFFNSCFLADLNAMMFAVHQQQCLPPAAMFITTTLLHGTQMLWSCL